MWLRVGHLIDSLRKRYTIRRVPQVSRNSFVRTGSSPYNIDFVSIVATLKMSAAFSNDDVAQNVKSEISTEISEKPSEATIVSLNDTASITTVHGVIHKHYNTFTLDESVASFHLCAYTGGSVMLVSKKKFSRLFQCIVTYAAQQLVSSNQVAAPTATTSLADVYRTAAAAALIKPDCLNADAAFAAVKHAVQSGSVDLKPIIAPATCTTHGYARTKPWLYLRPELRKRMQQLKYNPRRPRGRGMRRYARKAIVNTEEWNVPLLPSQDARDEDMCDLWFAPVQHTEKTIKARKNPKKRPQRRCRCDCSKCSSTHVGKKLATRRDRRMRNMEMQYAAAAL
jgi:hypothetical protein